MTDLRKMGNEELVNLAYGFGAFSSETIRAELLRRLAPSEGMKPRCPKCGKRVSFMYGENMSDGRIRAMCENAVHWWDVYSVEEAVSQFFSPARSGEPPTEQCSLYWGAKEDPHICRLPLGHHGQHVCSDAMGDGKCGATLSAARPSEPSTPQTSAEQYIGSDEERVILERKALGDFAAPQPVSGDAPKVEEVPLARKAAYALAYADAVAVDEMEAILRPYFPPASQTPDFKTLNATIGDLGEIAEMLREPQHEPTGFDLSIALRLEQITQTLKSIDPLATPASTARTDGWVSVEERLPKSDDDKEYVQVCWKDEWRGRKLSTNPDDDSIASPSGIDTCFIPYFVARHYHQATHWRELPAAPGSLPQAPDSPNKPPCPNCGCNHFRGENTLCNDGVPQAEPQKEEKL